MCDIAALGKIILISKALKCTLIVFVHKGDNVGANMADDLERLNLLAKENICRVLSAPKLAIVKILSGSECYEYFSDVYGPVHCSTIFFINSTTGKVLYLWDGREREPVLSFTDVKGQEKVPPAIIKPSAGGLRRRNAEDALLQLRAPDGAATTMTFPRGATLSVVRDAVVQRLRLYPGTFSIVNPYPRYEFSETDYRRTLEDLRLYPNSVLFISLNSEASSPKPWLEPFSAVFGLILNLFTSFWTYLRMALNFNRNRNEEEPAIPPKRRKRQGTRIQSQRNIHSLHDDDSSSDDNATYNGNSTQQQ